MGTPDKRFPAIAMGLPRPSLKWDGVGGWTPAQPTAQDLAFVDNHPQRGSVVTRPPRDLAGLGSQMTALCEMTRQLAVRLDRLTAVMSQFPAQMIQVLQVAGDLDLGKLIEYIRLGLASVPITHERVQVVGGEDVPITPVIKNPTGRSIPMMLTNDDNAQLLRWGSDTVTQINGAILSSEKTAIIVVPPDSYIYAIFPMFTSTVSISRLGIP